MASVLNQLDSLKGEENLPFHELITGALQKKVVDLKEFGTSFGLKEVLSVCRSP
jgi:hypothetical protein